MKRVLVVAVFAFLGAAFLGPTVASAQQFQLPGNFMDLRFPNGAGKSLTSPTGWGAAYQTVFAGFGYQNPVPFDDVDDGGIGFGVGLWDPVLFVGVQVGGAIVDVSEMGEFTMSAKVHRFLGYGTSIAFGVEDLAHNLKDDAENDLDLDPTFYGVVSHTLQNVDGVVPGAGRVHFSIGVGNGRFSEMPARTQIELGKENGSYVFGNAAVEVVRNLNVIGEWDGIGLNAGFAYTLPLDRAVAAFSAGVADITEYSSDSPRFILGAGLAYSIY